MSAAGLGVHEFSVVSNERVADGLMRVVLLAPELAGALRAGQFVNVAVPGDASQILRIPLSFSHADADAGTVEIVYAVVGDGTRRLAAMAAGTIAELPPRLAREAHDWTLRPKRSQANFAYYARRALARHPDALTS